MTLVLNLCPATEAQGKGAFVYVFEVAAYGDACGKAGYFNWWFKAQFLDDFVYVKGCCVAFYGWVGGYDNLGRLVFFDSFEQLGD